MQPIKPDAYKDGPYGRVPVYYGNKAVAMASRKYPDLTPAEKRVIMEEAYVDGVYLDHKGIPTSEVGQTGEYMKKGFRESFKEHEDRTRKKVPDYDILPDYLKEELVQSTYRGDLTGSPTAVKLFNQGKYKEAAEEFLRHDEYLSDKTPAQIKRRIQSVAKAMLRYGQEVKRAAGPGTK